MCLSFLSKKGSSYCGILRFEARFPSKVSGYAGYTTEEVFEVVTASKSGDPLPVLGPSLHRANSLHVPLILQPPFADPVLVATS